MKLPVVEIAAEAYHFLWRYRRTLVDRASLPMAVVLIIGILEYLISTPSPGGDLPAPAPVPESAGAEDAGDTGGATSAGSSALFLSLAYFIMTVPFLVGWYRLVVLGQGGVTGRSPLSFTRLEGRFLLWIMILAVVLVVPLVISGTIAIPIATGDVSAQQVGMMPMLVALLMLALLILTVLRLCFVFPAIAVDEPVGFARAWEMTKGNSLRIFGLMALVHIPAFVLGTLLKALVIGLGLPFSFILTADLAVSFIALALGATAFGEAYLRLR